jgi:hypothetical protein
MKHERIRSLRVGDLQKIFRHRYGHELPNDDAGRHDLRELLLPISLGYQANRKMKHAVDIWAKWMTADEAQRLIDEVNRTPIYLRKLTAQEMGQRQNITNHIRESLGLRTIAPIDLTPAQLLERRKEKHRLRMWRRRRGNGSIDREDWLTKHALTRSKPWTAKGISRATWYRRQRKSSKKFKTPRETGPCAMNLLTTAHIPVSHTSLNLKRGQPRKENRKKERQAARS